MLTRLRFVSAAALFGCLVAVPAFSQDLAPSGGTSGPAPANLAYIEGSVDLVHDGVAETATAPSLLLDGDVVRTGNGRAEIVFADGTIVHLDREGQLELLSPERLRLRAGRIVVRVSAAAVTRYVVDTPAASVRLDARGEYGLTTDARRPHLDLTVTRGVAEIDEAGQRILVRGGERLTLPAPGTRGLIEPYNSARWDAFDRWSSERADGFAAAPSSRQLPAELRAYGPVLDQYGRWDYVAPHGYVWFPSVAASWRPYYDGSWTHTRYGWTWLGQDRWAWPTHHYGRWGYSGASWYWIPARTWAGAWVSWAFAPGYVSWCPLGWDGRPVAGLWGRPGDHPAYWPNYSPWRAWTVMPRDHFGFRRAVRTHAIDGERLDASTRRAIVVQNTAPPAPVGRAVPRGTVTSGATAPGRVRSVDHGVLPGALVNEPRRGDVRRPTAPPPALTPPALPDTSTAQRSRDPRAVTSVLPTPTRRADDPPAIQRRDVEPDGAYRRREAPRATAPVYVPPAVRSRDGSDAATAPAPPPPDRAGRARGAVRDPGYNAPRAQESTPPPPSSTPPPARGDSGAVRRGSAPPPPSAPAASDSGAAKSGGAARRRPGA